MGAPGRPSGPRARPGACWSGIGGVRGAGRRQQAGVRSPVLRLKYSMPPDERCGPLARPAGQSEREAKRKALRAPRANRLRLRPYQPEGARSRLISEAKQGRAWLGSWMGDHLGIPGARGFLPTRRGPLAPAARPDSWIPPAAPAPPGPRGAAGRGPDSRCRPGLPPRGPRAPPHSHSASRTPDDRQSCLHLGLLWLASGNPGACTDSSQSPSPRPTPCLAGHRACACAHARTDRCAQTGHLSCSLIPWVYLCLGVGLLNHTLLPLLVPSGTSIIFSIPALPTPIPTHRGGEFPLLHIFSSIGY